MILIDQISTAGAVKMDEGPNREEGQTEKEDPQLKASRLNLSYNFCEIVKADRRKANRVSLESSRRMILKALYKM